MTGTESWAPPDDRGRAVSALPDLPTPRPAPPDAALARTGEPARSVATGCGLAWLVRSVTHVPGVLDLRDGRLRFTSTRGVIFDDTPAALGVTPARTSRGGFRLTVGGERLRLHVVRFDGATEVAGELRDREAATGLLTAGEPSAGPLWRQLLRDPGRQPARSRRACAAPAPWH